MDFPSFTFSGIRPAREQESAPDWDKITDSYEFEDGGRTFNEVSSVAPIRWEYVIQLPSVSAAAAIAAASVYHDFNNTVRRSQPFNFTDKFGTKWANVYVETYERSHDAHKSWVVTVKFGLVSFTGEQLDTTPPSTPPLSGAGADTDSILWSWTDSTD